MNRYIYILLIVFLQTTLFAAEFEVISFSKDPSDLSALKFPRKDINDENCALIKVRSDITGLMFDTNMGVTGLIEYKDGEYWIYVSPYERIVEIFRSGFAKFVYPIENVVEPATVYVMVIQIKEDEIDTEEYLGDPIVEKTLLKPQACSGTFIDERDGQEYKMVKIGELCWMGDNLNYNSFTSYCYKNTSSYCELYGRLYEWRSINDICPKGWHVPNKDDWEKLINEISEGSIDNGNVLSNDTTGILFQHAGFKFPRTRFAKIEKQGYFWSRSEFNRYDSWAIKFDKKILKIDNLDKDYGFSVRCVRDN